MAFLYAPHPSCSFLLRPSSLACWKPVTFTTTSARLQVQARQHASRITSTTTSTNSHYGMVIPKYDLLEEAAAASDGAGIQKQQQGLRLLTTWASPFGMRVVVGLHEKELEFEYVEEVLRSFSPEVITANPVHKKIPVLLHNGLALAESRIILEYLDEQWPCSSSSSSSSTSTSTSSRTSNFLPTSPRDRATTRFWADFVDSKFCEDLHDVLVTDGEKQQIAIGKTLNHLFRIEEALMLSKMNGGGPFFHGEHSMGFFDITFVGFLQWLHVLEFTSTFKIPKATKCPYLHAWIEATFAEPNVRKAIPDFNLLLRRARATRCRRDFHDWNTHYM